MKKIISSILITVMLVLQLCGCGIDEKEVAGASNREETQDLGGSNSQEGAGNQVGLSDTSSSVNLVSRDNSLDAYSAAVHTQLGMEKPANAVGVSKIFFGTSRAWYFRKHLFEKVEECWDELSFVTAEGMTGSKSFDRKNQLWDAGPVAGTDHYVVFEYEVQESGEGYRYFLTERDENHEVLREFPLDFLNGRDFVEAAANLSFFAVDCSGVVHLVQHTEEGEQYRLISPEGKVLAEYVPEDGYIEKLVPLYDGRVAFLAEVRNRETRSLQKSLRCVDVETGRMVLLAALEKEVYCFTLLDEHTLLYADREGVYRSGLSGENPELLYRWMNHGIAAGGVSAIQADEEGRIALVYEDSRNYHYLCLKPTTEEVEIQEITLAVSPMWKSAYQPLVVAFNRQYPSWHINLKDDYDRTALLTELIAGKGPVLIDTWLTGFEEQEALWEPLDWVTEQPDIMEGLLPSAMELGKINGTLYGIVTGFSLRTLVTGDAALKDWDYDAFLQCVEDRPELEAIFDLYGGDYGTYFIASFLSHGLDDTYLLDGETGAMRFDSSEFRRVLEMAKKYCVREDAVNPGRTLLEGKVLCNRLNISKPEDIALYRIYYGEDANYIGYPTKDGGAHFMESMGRPLAVRRTAAEEEKAAARAFISLCLSYEGQSKGAKDINSGLSVRRDVLEEQIAAMNEYTELCVSGFDQITLGDDLDIERDRQVLFDLVDQARPLTYFPEELGNIMREELEQYFAGTMTEDMLIDHLESRVGLYMGERN